MSLGFFLFFLSLITESLQDPRPLCLGNSYNAGRWVLNNKQTLEKAFLCCGWDNGDFNNSKLCGPTNNPKITLKTSFQGSNSYYSQPGAHSCQCDTLANLDPLAVSQREKYFWFPANCTLPKWDSVKFCRVLRDRKILMIGDSTNRQSASTLMSMIFNGGGLRSGNCSSSIYSARSDNLVSQANGSQNLSQIVNQFATSSFSLSSSSPRSSTLASSSPPDIVIISSGAHIRSNEEYIEKWKSISSQIITLHSQYPNISFLWKTQNPGHVLCQNDPKPLLSYEKRYEKRDTYKWNNHRDYDLISYSFIKNLTTMFDTNEREVELVKKENEKEKKDGRRLDFDFEKRFRAEKYSGELQPKDRRALTAQFDLKKNAIPVIQVLDMYPLYLRPDAHPHVIKDCLHYCQPGPLNLFPIILYNMLLTNQI
jgi:hypothetical protein